MAGKYVPIFFDWPEATKELKAQEKGRLIDAIVVYARGGDCSELLEGNERYLFPMFQLQIDRAREVSEIKAEIGARGGKQKQANRSKDKQAVAEPTYNNNNKEENENKNNNKGDNARARTRFTPPTVEEVSAFAAEKGYTGFSAQRFVDYYASKGWVVGKSPMKDWRAAVRGWVSRDGARQESAVKENAALQYQQREYKDDEFEDIFVGSPGWCARNPDLAKQYGFVKEE